MKKYLYYKIPGRSIVILIVLAVWTALYSTCSKNIPPEPGIPARKNAVIGKNVNEKELFEEFISSVFTNVRMRMKDGNMTNRDLFCLPLENSPQMNGLWQNKFKILFNSSAAKYVKLTSASELMEVLKKRKDIVILEPSEEISGQHIMIKINGYFPEEKRYIFSFIDSFEINQSRKMFLLNENTIKNDPNADVPLSNHMVGEINEEILAMKLIDVNKDDKRDLIMLAPRSIHIWIMAYDVILDSITLNLPLENETVSRDPAGILIYRGGYLFAINSFCKSAVCVNLKDSSFPIIECPDEFMQSLHLSAESKLEVSEGENYFKLTDSHGKEIDFHYLNMREEDTEFPDAFLMLSKDNRMIMVDNNDFSIFSTFDVSAGRAIGIKNTCVLSTLSSDHCPPDGITLLRWNGKNFNKFASMQFNNSCIFALDILECNSTDVRFYYSSYDSFLAVSRIFFSELSAEGKNDY